MLAIRCTLLRDVFEGGAADDPRSAEWPPSWMRLFSALVSVAQPGSPDDVLLRRLEGADPPDILAGEAVVTRRWAFVPTNAVEKETRHGTLPGRTNGERTWARAAPRSPDIWYRWRDLALDPTEQARLTDLCRRVPYLGRSTSPAIVAPATQPPEDDGWLRPRSAARADERFSFETSVRSPHAGALDALREAHQAKYQAGDPGDPWQVGIGVDYGQVTSTESGPVARQVYPMMLVLELQGCQLDGRHTARVAHALRRAVLSRAGRHLPTLHGHHDGNVLQCAFLGLVTVGHPRADGHLLGLAVAIPDLSAQELAVVAGALPSAGDSIELTAGPLGVLTARRVSPLTAQRLAWGLRPARWSGPARVWATATPIVLDRFPKRGGDVAAEVARAVVNSRLPAPTVVRVSRRPVIDGGPDFRPRDTLRRPGDRAVRPYRYALLAFKEPVRGPVVAGSMRHYGLGLCVPVQET